ncbi:MAG TPA: hypothetical protein VLD62_00610 [Acidimicrobiia bacterium]|nr:hypothetical protein [Acidimicrobiia bacterium]
MLRWIVGIIAVLAVAACSGDEAVPFAVVVEPPEVTGIIADEPLTVLVSVESEANDEVVLTASASGGEVSVDPPSIEPGQVAVVTVLIPWDLDERPRQVVVMGERDGLQASATVSTGPVVTVDEETVPYAGQVLAAFTTWLGDNRPALGLTTSTEFTGTRVAPVADKRVHHVFWTVEWEVGLTWRETVRPEDWAELYLRPRDALRPTQAFRLGSQRDAFTDGRIDVEQIEPPPTVVR